MKVNSYCCAIYTHFTFSNHVSLIKDTTREKNEKRKNEKKNLFCHVFGELSGTFAVKSSQFFQQNTADFRV